MGVHPTVLRFRAVDTVGIVETLPGQIRVESQPGEGLTFINLVPCGGD